MRIQQVTHCLDLCPLSFDLHRFIPILSHFVCDIAGGTSYHDCNLFGSDSYQFVLIFKLLQRILNRRDTNRHYMISVDSQQFVLISSSFSSDLAGATLSSHPFFFFFFFNILSLFMRTSSYYIFQGFQRRFLTRKKMKTGFTIHILIILFFFLQICHSNKQIFHRLLIRVALLSRMSQSCINDSA